MLWGIARFSRVLKEKQSRMNQIMIPQVSDQGPCRSGLPPGTVHKHWCGSTRQPPFFTNAILKNMMKMNKVIYKVKEE